MTYKFWPSKDHDNSSVLPVSVSVWVPYTPVNAELVNPINLSYNSIIYKYNKALCNDLTAYKFVFYFLYPFVAEYISVFLAVKSERGCIIAFVRFMFLLSSAGAKWASVTVIMEYNI